MSNDRSGSPERDNLKLLDLRDFFDAYDRTDPYHLSAVGELYVAIQKAAPHILREDSDWFETWKWGGKRDLRTGKLLPTNCVDPLTGLQIRDGDFIYPS